MDKEKITIICIEDRFTDAANILIEKQKKITGLDKSILFGSTGADVVIEKINSPFDYSNFVIKKLANYVKTEYALIIQLDGFVVNPDAWDDRFYSFDYIGAPWNEWIIKNEIESCVGNGGFSFRSKKLLDLCSYCNYNDLEAHQEDVYICRTNKNYFISSGCKFADFHTANKFSVENNNYKGQFGFHGSYVKNILNLN